MVLKRTEFAYSKCSRNGRGNPTLFQGLQQGSAYNTLTRRRVTTTTTFTIARRLFEADAARYWKDFNVTRDFLEALWRGIEIDNGIAGHFFGTVLPGHDITQGMNQISIPVLLLAGELDYDSVPLLLWPKFSQPQNMCIVNCGETGHWPNLEASDVFDAAWEKWLKSL